MPKTPTDTDVRLQVRLAPSPSDPASITLERKGWAETIDTLCGPYVTVDDEGVVLEETEAAVRAELDDLLTDRIADFLEDIENGFYSSCDETTVLNLRQQGRSDAEIAAELAEDDLAEYDATYAGVDTEGNVWALDTEDRPLRPLHRPDR